MADLPESYGMFYQWSRNIGWSSTEPLVNSDGNTTWDSSIPSDGTWKADNDSCPSGWRIPTISELQTLLNGSKVTSEWITLNDVTGNFIFLPAAGFCFSDHLTLGSSGTYWSNTQYLGYYADALNIFNGSVVKDSYVRSYGFSVRCVSSLATAIPAISTAQLSAYPNPVREELFIKSETPIKKVEIHSLAGDLRMQENNFTGKLSVPALPSGVYLLKIYSEKGITVRKLVKE
ncbi:MAG: T9SS type A sorting domain-containing protein [Dysgonamonadaceae bacterium]|jgi:uncharacterized protein (TIGR02145 family)|nr:T9SS type A sorting domain-containing protein [Dysgonamonadaceae bacterium]